MREEEYEYVTKPVLQQEARSPINPETISKRLADRAVEETVGNLDRDSQRFFGALICTAVVAGAGYGAYRAFRD